MLVPLAAIAGGQAKNGQNPAPSKASKDDLKQAEKLADQADKAAAAGKMREALADYQDAVRAAPGNLNIVRRAAAMRATAVQQLVDKAETAALSGDIDRATSLMSDALRVDPGNTIVAERLAQMKQIPQEYLPAGDSADYELKGPPALAPLAGKKAINVRGDSKAAYAQIGSLFGIKVTFDPDLIGRNVKLKLDAVDFATAISILGAETQTFYRVVNPTLIFVAQDTIAKRKEFSQEVEQTFRLDAAVAPEDMTELVRVLREITNSTRVQVDNKNHSLTLRETADRVALAGQLIRQLEQGRRDVMLDIELLEVDRNWSHTLGATPPSQIQAIPINSSDIKKLEQATDITNLLTLVSQIFQAQGITANPTQVLPVGGGKSTYLLTMPSVSATFAQGLSTVKSGREILMRAQDGKPATFFVGTRYPVTLSLLSTSLGSTVVGGTVKSTTFAQTNFTVGANPVALVAQDFNNDGLRDIAVVNKGDSTVNIFLNQDKGQFQAAPNSPITLGANEQGPAAIASAVFRVSDANHLVQPADLVIANSISNTVTVLLGSENLDGTFVEAAGSPFTVGANPSAVVIGDFDGDGNKDFAVVNQGDNTISVFKGDGAGNFTAYPTPFVLPSAEKGPIAAVSGVFDNSGKPEFAVLNATTDNIGIFQASFDNTFNGKFIELSGSPVASGVNPVAIAEGDLNADGFSDLAVVNQSAAQVTVLLNDGTGLFTTAAGSPLNTASTPSGVTIADFTNDGVGDIAVTNNGASTLGVYAGLGSGTFSQSIELTVPAGPQALISAQLVSANTLPDIALTASSAGQNFMTVLLDPSDFASGNSALQSPYPASEYIDLGIKVKATPAVHDDNEVTLQLEFEIRALSGDSVNGIPIITNRTVTQTVRLRENEPSVIAGLLDQEETKSLTGIPGLANLPGVGYAFGQRSKSSTDTQLLIIVTPRRMSDRIRQMRALYAGHGQGTGSSSPVAAPATQPSPAPDQQ